jgi:hypothetical protein
MEQIKELFHKRLKQMIENKQLIIIKNGEEGCGMAQSSYNYLNYE